MFSIVIDFISLAIKKDSMSADSAGNFAGAARHENASGA
jgi:hypothetical protein